ncbi:MAG: hypothetical protein H6807_14840 [Planctomycetes bacterium]|nr:hypothetical protein [Planctomycetota bacterium]
MTRSLFLILFIGLALIPARADELELRGGRVLSGRIVDLRLAGQTIPWRLVEGRIEAPKGALVVFERPYGPIEIPLGEVVRLVETEDDFDRCDRLAAELGDDLAGRLLLARWCREQGLRQRMRDLVALLLEEEPDLEEAHELIGEVLTEKGWMSASRARALARAQARAPEGAGRDQVRDRARLRRLEREMRRLAARIYSPSRSEGEAAYLALLELARREEIAGLAPIAARFHRDAEAQRAALAQATVTVNLQQASLKGLRERSINLGNGGAVRVQLPESRLVGIGTTVTVPLR